MQNPISKCLRYWIFSFAGLSRLFPPSWKDLNRQRNPKEGKKDPSGALFYLKSAGRQRGKSTRFQHDHYVWFREQSGNFMHNERCMGWTYFTMPHTRADLLEDTLPCEGCPIYPIHNWSPGWWRIATTRHLLLQCNPRLAGDRVSSSTLVRV